MHYQNQKTALADIFPPQSQKISGLHETSCLHTSKIDLSDICRTIIQSLHFRPNLAIFKTQSPCLRRPFPPTNQFLRSPSTKQLLSNTFKIISHSHPAHHIFSQTLNSSLRALLSGAVTPALRFTIFNVLKLVCAENGLRRH